MGGRLGWLGEDGQLQRILEAKGIPYTGEGIAGSELAIDKIAAKRRFKERGVPTAEFEVIPAGDRPTMVAPLVACTTKFRRSYDERRYARTEWPLDKWIVFTHRF